MAKIALAICNTAILDFVYALDVCGIKERTCKNHVTFAVYELPYDIELHVYGLPNNRNCGRACDYLENRFGKSLNHKMNKLGAYYNSLCKDWGSDVSFIDWVRLAQHFAEDASYIARII